MTQDITARNIKKFDGTNFQGWKFQMKSLFTANEIEDIIDGSRVMPRDQTTNEAKTWVRDNAKAMFLTSSALEYAQLEPLLVCETAKDMWDNLCRIHEQKSATNKLLLLQKFHEYRMASSDSVVQHIAKIRNMAAQIEDVGEKVSELTVIAKILGSLSPKYSTLQTAWDSVDPTRQTLNNLEERLIREELRLGIESEGGASAFAVSKREGQKKGKPNKTKKDIKCYRCHEMGHFARECSKKQGRKDNDDQSRDCAFIAEKATNDSQLRELLAAKQCEVWLTDSGASRHMTYRRDWISNYRPNKEGGKVSLGDGEECDISGEGVVYIKRYTNGLWCDARIENVLYIPNLKKNLFSVGACTKKGFEVTFKDKYVNIMRERKVVASGVRQDNDIYRMCFRVSQYRTEEANVSEHNLRVWHERLGHVDKRAIRELVKKGLVHGVSMTNTDDFVCEMCRLGKAHRMPFKTHEKVSTKPGEVIHTDVCGPMSVETPGGSKYFLTFKDDATGYRHVYFLRHKAEVAEKFRLFEKSIANKFGRTMKILRSDNGREFCNREMDNYLTEKGIKKENTAPYTPQQNGKAERDNRTIVESARTMIHAKSLPLSLWAEAVNTAIYVLNRTVSSGGDATPYEMWVGKKPMLSHLRIFGSVAYVLTPKQFTKKLDLRGRKMILVGYEGDSTNYRVYDPSTKNVIVTRDATFFERVGKINLDEEEPHDETIVFHSLQDEGRNEVTIRDAGVRQQEAEDVDQEVRNAQELQEAAPEDGRILRNRATIRCPARYDADVAEYTTPNSYEEAIQGSEAKQWAQAIKEELLAHQNNNTWSIVPRTPEVKTIDSKWVFKIKDDSIKKKQRFKARLCARGFLQQQGRDYTETFAPVVRYDSLRVLLAAVTEKDLELLQFDVQTAFLYGELKEDIYMEVPEGLNIGDVIAESVTCKLNKSLYGLKQAPRCWNQKFTQFLQQFKFKCSEADQCIFAGRVNDEIVYLALFVDDGLVAAKSESTLNLIANRLSEAFDIKIGDSSSFVGMQIKRDRITKKLVIHQSEYIKRIISKFGMCDAKTVSVPADPHTILYPAETDEERINNVPYREAVGSLVFLAAVSRPDIAYAVNSVSKFLNNHSVEYWRAVKRIFAYLKGTVNHGIEYKNGGSEAELIGFSDADYASDIETRRSTTGYIFYVANGPVSWSSQRQKMVVLSTTEAEYVAASTATKEAMWLRKLLNDISHPCQKETTIYVDNQSAIRLVKNPEFHKRTKHIDIRYHYIREKYESKDIVVKYIPSELQRADILTKTLPRDRFKKLCEITNIASIQQVDAQTAVVLK